MKIKKDIEKRNQRLIEISNQIQDINEMLLKDIDVDRNLTLCSALLINTAFSIDDLGENKFSELYKVFTKHI